MSFARRDAPSESASQGREREVKVPFLNWDGMDKG